MKNCAQTLFFIMESEPQNAEIHCYCRSNTFDDHMFTCINCKKLFHIKCLKSGKPSELAGDIYFKFTCANCSSDGAECFKRMKLQWTTVLILSLYNLQLQGSGKCGYFRWREQVCRFVDKNWTIFFGTDKKKSATWHGTVAGCLSNGANRFFVSGVEVLGESGWWTLKSSKLPTLAEVESSSMNTKLPRKRKIEESLPIVEGSRRKNSNILEAALSLKEKKACILDDPRPKIKKKQAPKASIFPPNHKIKMIVPKIDPRATDASGLPRSLPKIIIKTERGGSPRLSEDTINQWRSMESDDIGLGISSNLHSMFDLSNPLDSSDPFNSLLEDVFSEISCDKASIKSSPKYESDDENSNSIKAASVRKVQQHVTTSRKKKAVTKEENPIKETVILDPKYTMMSPYEEQLLLLKLEGYPNAMKQKPEVRRLYRKLVVRKLKREKDIAVFDIDVEVRSIRGMDPPEYFEKDDLTKINNIKKTSTILDRFQMGCRNLRNKSHQYSSFLTRLMGLEDEQYESFISPYTERILKPFIFRDYVSKPLKLQLLEEIISRANKSNPHFVPKKNSIDYCYVRPEHIPAINAMCQEYFWPGIDLSDSLQYPDFSCVALYRKVIIGFAFMVPDVKYNEAYITFIFCHPEWRRAGIATFMLYHLIQTCMGKDVTLHVSATSSAAFLYQKFGFKVEELIQDFYDKYLPPESKECRHALFLRLNR